MLFFVEIMLAIPFHLHHMPSNNIFTDQKIAIQVMVIFLPLCIKQLK